MMAVYSHVQRKALDEAANALEPDRTPTAPPQAPTSDAPVTSQVTSRSRSSRRKVIDFVRKSGGPRRTPTCDPLVCRVNQVVFFFCFFLVFPPTKTPFSWCLAEKI